MRDGIRDSGIGAFRQKKKKDRLKQLSYWLNIDNCDSRLAARKPPAGLMDWPLL